ncbi:hypothetical protein OQA88_11966 [Cercophora sp. LCS_1]
MPPKPTGIFAPIFLFTRACNILILIAQAALIGQCLALAPHDDHMTQRNMIGMLVLTNTALVWSIVSWSGYSRRYIAYTVTWAVDFVFLAGFLAASVVLAAVLSSGICADLSKDGQASCQRHSVIWSLLMISCGVFAISGLCVACVDCEGRSRKKQRKADRRKSRGVGDRSRDPARSEVFAPAPSSRPPRWQTELIVLPEADESARGSWTSWARGNHGNKRVEAPNRELDTISPQFLGPPATPLDPSPYSSRRFKRESGRAPPPPLRSRRLHPDVSTDSASRREEPLSVSQLSSLGGPVDDIRPVGERRGTGKTSKWVKHIGNTSPVASGSVEGWPQQDPPVIPSPLFLGRALNRNTDREDRSRGQTKGLTATAAPPRSQTAHLQPPAPPQQRQSVLARYSPSLYETERPSTSDGGSSKQDNGKKVDKGKGVDRSEGYEAGFTEDRLRELTNLDDLLDSTPIITSPRIRPYGIAMNSDSTRLSTANHSVSRANGNGVPSTSVKDTQAAGEWDYIRAVVRSRATNRPASTRPAEAKGSFDPYNFL